MDKTVWGMKQCRAKDDQMTLHKLPTASECERGARTILTVTDEKMTAKILAFAALVGFAANAAALRSIMAKLASDTS